MTLILHSISSTKQGGYFEYKPMYISQLPIRPINLADQADKARHDRIVKLVESMLTMHEQLTEAKSSAQKEIIQRQIDSTDKEIDQVVCELYDLTKDEIKIVEGESKCHPDSRHRPIPLSDARPEVSL